MTSTVSWIRHRDIHILTVGAYTYTSDQRFQAIHHRSHSDQWTLHIKWAQKRDAGIYECQVSTQPVRSIFVTLNVVDDKPPPSDNDDSLLDMMIRDGDFTKVPSASISGGPDIHVNEGSTINLTCIVKFSPEPPSYIFWYHYDEVISYDSVRGGVSVVTEKGDVTVSYLLIQDAVQADSGKYTCNPSNADLSSVVVHVLNVLYTLEELENHHDSDTSSKSSQLLNAIIKSEFVISLNVAGELFSLNLPFCKVLQKVNCDLYEACEHIENISKILMKKRENANEEFSILLNKSKNMLESVNNEIAIPRINSRQTKRINIKTNVPEEYFRISIYIPLLDDFIQQPNERFNNKKELITSLQNVIPKFCVNKKYKDIKPCVDFYIGNSNSLAIEAEFSL
ncbi:hypothetical protein QTP88_012033 [Uroleucon formosanum]